MCSLKMVPCLLMEEKERLSLREKQGGSMRGSSPHPSQKGPTLSKSQRGGSSLRRESSMTKQAIISSKDTDGKNILIWQPKPTLRHLESKIYRQELYQITIKESALRNFSAQINILQMQSLTHAPRRFHLKMTIIKTKVRAKEVVFRRDPHRNTIGLNRTCTVRYLKVILRITWSIKKKRIREDRVVKLEILNLKMMQGIQWWCWRPQEMPLGYSHLTYTLSKLK